MRKARMTERRREVLKLIAKGFNNEQITKATDLSLSNTKMQKSRLYSYLGIHTAIDAIYVGLQEGLLYQNDLSEEIKAKIYDGKKQKVKDLNGKWI